MSSWLSYKNSFYFAHFPVMCNHGNSIRISRNQSYKKTLFDAYIYLFDPDGLLQESYTRKWVKPRGCKCYLPVYRCLSFRNWGYPSLLARFSFNDVTTKRTFVFQSYNSFCFTWNTMECDSVSVDFIKLQSRSEFLSEKNEKHPGFSDKTESHLSLDKTVDVVLDSFDNLFCRRCLVHSTSGNISLIVLLLVSVFCLFVQLHSSRSDLFHDIYVRSGFWLPSPWLLSKLSIPSKWQVISCLNKFLLYPSK